MLLSFSNLLFQEIFAFLAHFLLLSVLLFQPFLAQLMILLGLSGIGDGVPHGSRGDCASRACGSYGGFCVSTIREGNGGV